MTMEIQSPQWESRSGWGMANTALSRIVRPTTTDQVQQALEEAAKRGWPVHLWGNGRSYGDAALNEGGLLLDMSGMNRVLDWQPETGIVCVEPGITIEGLWHHCIEDGYWPPVVSGTQTTTIGGCVSANAHGKNNRKYGPIGDHVIRLTVVTPDGTIHELSPDTAPDLFSAVIGGFGMLGVITSITLQMKQVGSGRLEVSAHSCADLNAMFEVFEQCEARDFDYVVGWVDAFPRGNALGRGQVHAANYVSAERDPEGARMLSVGSQIPGKFAFGVLPRSWMWFLAKPWAHRLGMRLINWGRFFWASRKASGESHFVSHAQFNFLLDFVPNWKWIYRPGGLIQFQLFLPLEHAKSGFRKAIELQQSLGLESWLMVMKRHRSDAFWLSHAVDGYSLAMDFPVTDRNRAQLFQMTRRFERLVVEANGRFYFAKDAVVSAEAVRRSLGPAILGRFFELKNRVDPKRLLTGNLFRRVFAPLLQEGQGDSERVGPPEAVAVEPTS